LPLIQGQYGLVSLATYPISPLSVIDLSSESTCICLCSIKAPAGIFCLFDKLYHVLLRLSFGVVCHVLYVFSTLCQVMVQLLLQIFVQASCHGSFQSGPGLTRVCSNCSAAMCQLWCSLSAQQPLVKSAVSSAATCQLSCRLNCTLLAPMHFVISVTSC